MDFPLDNQRSPGPESDTPFSEGFGIVAFIVQKGLVSVDELKILHILSIGGVSRLDRIEFLSHDGIVTLKLS